MDGSHAVGALPLDIPSLGCDYYTSNLHKWLCTPKGSALLWVHPARQFDVKPLVVSHGYKLVSWLLQHASRGGAGCDVVQRSGSDHVEPRLHFAFSAGHERHFPKIVSNLNEDQQPPSL